MTLRIGRLSHTSPYLHAMPPETTVGLCGASGLQDDGQWPDPQRAKVECNICQLFAKCLQCGNYGTLVGLGSTGRPAKIQINEFGWKDVVFMYFQVHCNACHSEDAQKVSGWFHMINNGDTPIWSDDNWPASTQCGTEDHMCPVGR
jgi:hypothetical protein